VHANAQEGVVDAGGVVVDEGGDGGGPTHHDTRGSPGVSGTTNPGGHDMRMSCGRVALPYPGGDEASNKNTKKMVALSIFIIRAAATTTDEGVPRDDFFRDNFPQSPFPDP